MPSSRFRAASGRSKSWSSTDLGAARPHKKPILILNIANFWEPLCVLLEQMERLDFIRAGLPVKLLVAERVEEILPKLLEAARSVSEPEKEMTSVAAERM